MHVAPATCCCLRSPVFTNPFGCVSGPPHLGLSGTPAGAGLGVPVFVCFSERSSEAPRSPCYSRFLSLAGLSGLRCFVQTNASCFLTRKSETSGRNPGLISIVGNVVFLDFMKNGLFRRESSR